MRCVVVVVSLMALSACATSPKKIPAQYVSPALYENYDCEQLALEKYRMERRTTELYTSLKNEANADAWQMGLGLALFFPVLFMLEGGDGPEATEYSRLRGEYEAVSSMSIQKKCGIEFVDDLSDHLKEEAEQEAEIPEAL
ncbi:MAG: metal ABC transporter ATP-binding protein [Pseudomonadota bacterium]